MTDPVPAEALSGPSTSPVLTPATAAPLEIIQQQQQDQDYLVLRFAVIGLVIAVMITLVAVALLAYQNKPIPDGVLAIGSAGVGALATMLVRPPAAR